MPRATARNGRATTRNDRLAAQNNRTDRQIKQIHAECRNPEHSAWIVLGLVCFRLTGKRLEVRIRHLIQHIGGGSCVYATFCPVIV